MSFEIKPLEVELPVLAAPRDELRSVIDEYTMGVAAREVALFRVWRLWREDLFTSIYDDTLAELTPMFPTANDFIMFLCKRLDVSRSKVYTRLKTYSLMEFLEYTDKEIVLRMARKPGLYEKSLNMIFEWDMESRQVVDLKTDVFGASPFDGVVRAKIRYFLDELEGSESVMEALQTLEQDVLQKPQIKTRFAEDYFTVTYNADFVDGETGEMVFGDKETIEFYTTSVIPSWVKEELARKYGGSSK